MKAVPKNFYFHVLNDNMDKYNNTYHNTIKIENSYAEYNVDSNAKDPEFLKK